MPRATSQPLVRIGNDLGWWQDIYHRVLVLRWWWFLPGLVTIYLLLNTIFACLYLLEPGAIVHARPGSFADAFYFSVQTISTIGYGELTPTGRYANGVMVVESMAALVITALLTGLTFARFARPTARVAFTRAAPVSRRNGVPTLFVRLSNSRRNQILEANVRLTLLRNEVTEEGQTMRRFHDLALSRDHTPVFSLTFTVMHPIDAVSPLHGATTASLLAEGAEILVTVTGLDETMSQTIHARTSYRSNDIVFGYRFVDMFTFRADGRVEIDLGKFHAMEPAE